MANAIKKIADSNGIYQYVEQINISDYTTTKWLIDPDITALSLVPQKYWKVISSGSPLVYSVIEMTTTEKSNVDLALSYVNEVTTAPISVIFTRILNFADSEIKTITLPKMMNYVTVNVYDTSVPVLTQSKLLSPGGIPWDPNNRSSNNHRLIDGNYFTAASNNTTPNNTSGLILGVDMGTPTLVNALKMVDGGFFWFCTGWELIGTNDPLAATANLTTILSEKQTTTKYTWNKPFLKTFPDATFRYFGLKCVTSKRPRFAMWKEMQLLTGIMANVEQELALGKDFKYSKINNNTLELKNLKKIPRTFKIVITGN